MSRVRDSIRRTVADYAGAFGTSPREMLIDLALGAALLLLLAVEVTIGIAGVWS